jgi:hypothetical protein
MVDDGHTHAVTHAATAMRVFCVRCGRVGEKTLSDADHGSRDSRIHFLRVLDDFVADELCRVNACLRGGNQRYVRLCGTAELHGGILGAVDVLDEAIVREPMWQH